MAVPDPKIGFSIINFTNTFRTIRLIFFIRTIIGFLKADNLGLNNIEQQETYDKSLFKTSFKTSDFYIIRWKKTIRAIAITYPPIIIHKFNALNYIIGRKRYFIRFFGFVFIKCNSYRFYTDINVACWEESELFIVVTTIPPIFIILGNNINKR